ncbi:MAG: hypothetical protein HYX73_03220 [Acidobacteria bacterium]|nr:hypothetical protein [Acidobacteriota bacterium]
MENKSLNRRDILRGFGVVALSLPGLRFPAWGAQSAPPLRPQSDIPVINTMSVYGRGQWYYDPVGLYIRKGQTVRWNCTKWGVTVTAFHPSNDNHELRIPEAAEPFDSGVLGQTYKNTFDWTFDVEGTYDYFSRNHEILGMVGRIVVGSPGGPAEKYQPGYGAREGRAVVFPAQIELFSALGSQEILAKKAIPFPQNLLVRTYPYGDWR